MERYDLPNGWEWMKLPDVADIIMGQSPPGSTYNKDGNGLPFYQGKADFGNPYPTPRVYCTAPKKIAKPGDILMSVRAPVGPTNLVNQECAIGRGLSVVRPKEGMPASYLRAYFTLIEPFIAELGTGSTFSSISRSDLEGLDIPVSPLPERQPIVSKIESLFEQSLTARAALMRVPQLMSQFRRAVLASAFRGELVEPDPNDEPTASLLERVREAREQSGYQKSIETIDPSELPRLPEGWEWVRFEQILAELKNGHFSKAPAFELPGIPILRISAVRPLSVKLDDPRFFRGDFDNVAQYKLQNGDLLFTRYNGSLNLVGVCGMVRDLNDVMIYPDKLIRARFFENTVAPTYLEYYFASALPRSIIEDKAKSSAGQQGISGKDLKDVPVPLPPLAEQQRIAVKLETLFAQANIIEQAASVSLHRAEQIDQSILARAFRGELR